MKKKILIIGGDPNSINSEIIFKSWKKINNSIKKRIYFVSNYNLIQDQLKKLNFSIKLKKVVSHKENLKENDLKIIDVPITYKNPFNVPKKNSSKFVLKSINLAHQLCVENKDLVGLINCPTDKTLLNKKEMGVTEYLASRSNINDNSEVMLLKGNKISVVPITTHISLKQVSKSIKYNIIIKKILTLNNWFKSKLKFKPRICILGLNPHNSELRNSSEEKKIIIPAIKSLRKKGLLVSGPMPADTVFIKEYKNFDVIVGMYHDQVLPSFKALCKFDAINITLGLKYLRLSPDHGVAKQIIYKNKANPSSLIKCIKFINKFS